SDYRPGLYREMWEATGAATLLLGLVVYGQWRLQHPPFEKGPRGTAIQADIPQDAKMAERDELFVRYDKLCRTAAGRADLVVWPETCYPFAYCWLAPGTNPAAADPQFLADVRKSRELLAEAAGAWKTNVLLGLS